MSDSPRERYDLVPDAAAELAFLDALERGRLHHAWLLSGIEGTGKATFAYRAARRLLGATPDPQRGPLGARPDDPVSRQIAAQSHPDLLVLERLEDGGKLKKTISVDQARALPEFFSKSPSQARYRVAIIDAADHLNNNAANALLKILEEPPEKGVLFLISHAPGRLLPTIRSRCRRLPFPVWPSHALAVLVRDRTGIAPSEADLIADMAGGSPGQAISLASGPMMKADQTARAWVSAASVQPIEVLAAIDGFRGAGGQERYSALVERLAAAVQLQAMTTEGAASARWAELWSRIVELTDRAQAVNMDKADVVHGIMGDLARTKAATGHRGGMAA